MSPSNPRVAVLGAGSWGTALAAIASRRCDTVLWGRDGAQMANMQATRQNARYLPNIDLPGRLRYTADFSAALAHLEGGTTPPLIILGVPMAGLEKICRD